MQFIAHLDFDASEADELVLGLYAETTQDFVEPVEFVEFVARQVQVGCSFTYESRPARGNSRNGFCTNVHQRTVPCAGSMRRVEPITVCKATAEIASFRQVVFGLI
jgi:hypothetical protein